MNQRTLSEISKASIRAGNTQPQHRLECEGEDLTDIVESLSGSFEEDSGGSQCEMTFVPGADIALSEYQDRIFKLWVGFGESPRDATEPYFAGRLHDIAQGSATEQPSGTAYGPFLELGASFFENDLSYVGATVEEMFMDLTRRAQMPLRKIEVKGGDVEIAAENAIATIGMSYLEMGVQGSQSLGFVQTDLTDYARLVMPEPMPHQAEKYVEDYGPDDYLPGQFTADPESGTRWRKALLYRRGDDGTYPVKAEAEVPNRGGNGRIPPARILTQGDFAGNQSQAEIEVKRLAMNASRVRFNWGLTVGLNPTIKRFSTIRGSRLERVGRRAQIALVSYACLVKGLGFEIAEGAFSGAYSGTASRLSIDLDFERESREGRLLSRGVVFA